MASSTRERLVDAARQLFHEQGYEATGIATILREAGARPGSLYHFFPSKEALLEAVFDWYDAHLVPVVLAPIESAQDDPLERIFDLLDWYRAGMVATDCRKGCPIGNLALELSDSHPQVRPRIDALLQGWSAGIRRWLDEAGAHLPAAVDRAALADFVLTVMEGGLLQARAAADLAPFDRSVRVLRDHVDRLRAQAGSPDSTAPRPRAR